MESKEQISRMVEEELGRAKHRREYKNSIVMQEYGKPFKELTAEEKKEYYKGIYYKIRDEEYLAKKREYMRKRYAEKREEILAKAKERYAEKKKGGNEVWQ